MFCKTSKKDKISNIIIFKKSLRGFFFVIWKKIIIFVYKLNSMGCWSVYCGLSNITISEGHDCVFLPLKKSKGGSDTYLPYLPATLPIFGKYDDYGGIEFIIKDDNTMLIEDHFNCTIENFCQMFTRGMIDKNDVNDQNLLNISEMSDWTYMWINREVYNFLSEKSLGYEGAGHLRMGSKELLELIGFSFVEELSGLSCDNGLKLPFTKPRYCYIWEYQGNRFESDGEWLNYNNKSIFRFSELEKIVDIPEDKKWIGEKSSVQLWNIYDDKFAHERLFCYLGKNRYGYDDGLIAKLFSKLSPEKQEILKNEKDFLMKTPKDKMTIVDKYWENYKKYGDILAGISTIRHNMYSMSQIFSPYVLYVTPQCGDYEVHQILLNKFSEINFNLNS